MASSLILNNKSMSIYYQNVRGLNTKTLELYNNILTNDYDLLLFTETWIQSNILDTELCDRRYEVFRCDRDRHLTNKVTGGGVVLCARSELGVFVTNQWSCPSVESVCVSVPARVLNSSVDLHVVLIYVPPDKYQLAARLNSVQASLAHIIDLFPSDNFLVIGDFNTSCIQWKTDRYSVISNNLVEIQNAAVSLMDELTFLGFTQYNYIPNSCNNILDLCFCGLPLSVVCCSDPLSKVDVFHPPLTIEILDISLKPLRECHQPKYNFRKCNYDRINEYLYNLDWRDILNTETVDEAVDVFYNTISESLALFVPLSARSTNSHRYPNWYSPALIKIIREKLKVHKRWKKFGNPRDYDEFSLLRVRQKCVQNKCFEHFTRNSERNIKYSPKLFWKYVKSKRGGSNYPHSFTLGNLQVTNGQNICTAFNSFFKSVYGHPISHQNNDLMTSCYYSSNDSLSRIDVTAEMVFKLLTSLDKSKGPGCDGIPPIFLSACARSLAFPVSVLFQRSLTECTFPTLWKKAQIIPIHKKGSRSVVENYRPISILNTLAKLFEKIVYGQVYPFISRGISYSQHGFLRGRSTVSNLSCFSNYVLEHMEGGGQVDVIYTDFEKAFDRVDHDILLMKLHALGIQGDLLRWVKSYLSNRSQAVVLGGFRSDYVSIPAGVPQGSHLGPLFYNAYIFDIYTSLSNSHHLLYADDKKIYINVRSVADCERLQDDLNNLHNYYINNRITVSINKCYCISFTRKLKPISFPYTINNIAIERVEVVRDLGVTLDSKMRLNDHIDSIVDRSFRNLGFVMRTCKPFKGLTCIKVVYYAYVRSILEYASPIWSPFYAIHIDKIERIQKKFLKHLNYKFRKPGDSSYVENCRTYNLLTLEERREVMDMGLLYDVVRGRIDCPELVAGVSLCAPARRTRHTTLFHVPFHSSNYGKNAVLTRLPRVYNQKFQDIDIFIETKNSFKQKIRLTLLGNP